MDPNGHRGRGCCGERVVDKWGIRERNVALHPKEIDCLSDALLQDLMLGREFESGSREQILSHVGSCPICAERLRLLGATTLLETISLGRTPAERSVTEPSPGTPPEPVSAVSVSTQTFQFDDSAINEDRRKEDRPEQVFPAAPGELPVKLGPYFIIKRLGEGGFGTVYLARDTVHQRQVALKVPRADRIYTGKVRREFLREARLVAQLHHPHIVPLYDCHELDDGRITVSMQYVEGSTLRAWMRAHKVTQDQAVHFVSSIADALHYAHQRTDPIWHRDVKPENILLDHQLTPYLTDFGLGLSETEQSQLQIQMAGTHAYMSPEQIQGHVTELDARSDLWSLGVVLYELLTKQRPFQGATLAEVKQEVLHRQPRPPRQINRTIPIALEQICLRCLAKNPQDRFASAGELAERLRAHAKTRTWSRRNLVTLVAAATLLGLPPLALWLAAIQANDQIISSSPAAPYLGLQPVFWTTRDPNDFFRVKPRTGIEIKSMATPSCFETHAVTRPDFQVQIEAELQEVVASAGIALQIRKTGDEPPTSEFVTIELDCHKELRDYRLICHRFKVGRVDFHKERLESIEFQIPKSLQFNLLTEIRDNRISRVLFNGQEVPEITSKMNKIILQPGDHVGVVASGTVLFSRLLVKEL